MKHTALLLMAMLLGTCAAQDERRLSTQDETQAVRDFIDVGELVSVDEMRTSNRDSFEPISDRFVIYKGRRATHLVEFNRRCYELEDNHRIVADQRWDANTIRARFDTLRGCRIDKIYALSEEQAEELENIGEAPGSRN